VFVVFKKTFFYFSFPSKFLDLLRELWALSSMASSESDAHSQSENSQHERQESEYGEHGEASKFDHQSKLKTLSQNRLVSGTLGRQLWMKHKDSALRKLQQYATNESELKGTFAILPLDLNNFQMRFGNTPLGDEYYSAVIDYLHASTVKLFIKEKVSSEIFTQQPRVDATTW